MDLAEGGRRLSARSRFLLALLAAAAYFLIGLVANGGTAATGPPSASMMLLLVTVWIVALVVGGWLLGRNAGALYAVGVTSLQVPIALLTHQPIAREALVWWSVSVLVAVVFGGLAGALADQFSLARVRNRELARANAELHQAGAALARSEAMFRQFADRVELGVWIAPSHPGAHIFMNPAARQLLGIADEAHYHTWLDTVYPDDRRLVEAAIASLQAGEPQDIEYRVKAPGQPARWVRAQSFAVLDSDGKPSTLTGLLEDVTERKEREAKREAIERRERLSALGTLVAGVAHEINNPLTYVLGNMELARVEHQRLAKAHHIPPEDAARYERLMSTSYEGSQRIARIVRALRAVTRGRQGGAIEDVNLNSLAMNVHALVRAGVPGHISLDLALSPTDPIVRGNSGELHQILLNLATNAIQAMGEKSGRILIETRVDAANAVLAVRDEGPGIPPEVRKHLFTPFFTTKQEGTGLGLSIAHSIVQDHGGDIDVESRPGEGALFRVRLPRSDAPTAREVIA